MQSCYPITRPVRTTEPTIEQEPIAPAEARVQCNLTYDPPDLLDWIRAARRRVERDMRLVCYTGSFTWKMTEFGGWDYFELPDVRNITAITSIVYVASDGTSTTWSSSNYNVTGLAYELSPRVDLAYGAVWPTLRGDANGITITYVAGYSSVAVVPPEVKNAVKLALKIDFLNRVEKLSEAEQCERAYQNYVTHFTPANYS